jgi:hypothetical protein
VRNELVKALIVNFLLEDHRRSFLLALSRSHLLRS